MLKVVTMNSLMYTLSYLSLVIWKKKTHTYTYAYIYFFKKIELYCTHIFAIFLHNNVLWTSFYDISWGSI